MVSILKMATTIQQIEHFLRTLKQAGYVDVRLDLRGTHGNLVVKAWGGDYHKFRKIAWGGKAH